MGRPRDRPEAPPPASGTGWIPVVPAPILDACIALGVALLAAASGFGARAQGERVPAAAIPVLAAMGVILLWRRRFPGPVLAVMAVLVTLLVLMRTSLEGAFIAVLIASYSAAVYGTRRLAIGLTAATCVAVVAVGIPRAFGASSWPGARFPVPTLLAAAGAWIVGLAIRSQFATRSAHLAVLRERAELIAEKQQEETLRATLAERLRIARELHDIVAHHLSVVVIQAQGAQRTLSRDPDRARTAMADVERTARTALDEMRRLLGLLRSGEPTGADRGGRSAAPDVTSPGYADLDALVARMTAAGVPVTLRTSGVPRSLPEDVGLAVYRIVQEALTNVLKHAGPAETEVLLDFGDDLAVTVTDDGRGASAHLDSAGVPGAGRGTIGMRERVAALGGHVTFGPRPGGGFCVRAVIPLEES